MELMKTAALKHVSVSVALLATLLVGPSAAQTGIRHSIYLIGDAGKDTLPGPALRLLGEQLDRDSTSTVLFLGDNVYPAGLEGKDGTKKLRASEQKLMAQLIQTEDHHGNVFWLPGNHDWKAGRWKGMELVKIEADFVESFYTKNGNIKNKESGVFLPKNGFPGPEYRVFEEDIHLIAIDIQWWLQAQFFHNVPKEQGRTKRQMEKQFLARLDSLLRLSTSSSGHVLIAAHHPMYSNGHHGGRKQPLRFMVNWVPPFQLFGLIGLNRALVQDIPAMRYRRIRNRIMKVIDQYKGVTYVSGHDHNLQYMKKKDNHHLISGAGSKRSSLQRDRNRARFMDDRNYGFMRLDIMEDGSKQCHVFGHLTGGTFHKFNLD